MCISYLGSQGTKAFCNDAVRRNMVHRHKKDSCSGEQRKHCSPSSRLGFFQQSVPVEEVRPNGASSPFDLTEITPVEKIGDFYFKRDDLFSPFPDVNGSKVRQMLYLLQMNREKILSKHGGKVAVAVSVYSPQVYRLAKCCKELGLQAIVGIGASEVEEAIAKHEAFRLAKEAGADIRKLAGIGYPKVLDKRLQEMSRKEAFYILKFGLNSSDLSINIHQVNNISGYDNLVIPCGSGVTASAILQGLGKVARPKNIFVVQIAGMDRQKDINSPLSYTFIADKIYPYSKRVPVSYKGLELDDLYEAKAFQWLLKQKLSGRTLFWIVGNSNKIRGNP
jgi:1-aminocyclopropane-1-carboxylate deaminase/D-cysteine desulfhydrase-like pyridoxal-dependent ACC family enzyme